MELFIKETVKAITVTARGRQYIIIGIGAATFFFGFAAGAILNIYLLWIQSPLVLQYRSSLNYISAIVGDGILLPLVNMLVMAFLLKHLTLIRKKTIQKAVLLGAFITMYFHISQAVNGIVNWAMPRPWHWNMLGIWHAVYMLSVTSLLSLFLLVTIKVVKKEKVIPKEVVWVLLGVGIFLLLLRFDYADISLSQAFDISN